MPAKPVKLDIKFFKHFSWNPNCLLYMAKHLLFSGIDRHFASVYLFLLVSCGDEK